MRDCPAEIDFRFHDFSIANCQDFAVAEALAASASAFVGDEHVIAIWHNVDEIELGDCRAIWPAVGKIGRPVDMVIKRAGEMEIIGDQLVDCCAILVDVSKITRAGDVLFAACCSARRIPPPPKIGFEPAGEIHWAIGRWYAGVPEGMLKRITTLRIH